MSRVIEWEIKRVWEWERVRVRESGRVTFEHRPENKKLSACREWVNERLKVCESEKEWVFKFSKHSWFPAFVWHSDIFLCFNNTYLSTVMNCWAISLTSLWKGSFLMSNSVDFWYLRISLRATTPGLNLWGFFTCPTAGAVFLAALVTICFLGAFPPVDFLAVCLVRAMLDVTSHGLQL